MAKKLKNGPKVDHKGISGELSQIPFTTGLNWNSTLPSIGAAGSKKIHFLNMHPENSWEVTLEKVKNIIGVGN